MGTTIIHLRCAASGAAGNGLGATMKYLRRTTSAAANNGMSTTIIPPCSEASFEVNSEPHTGARPSVRLCVGPELARCVHKIELLPKVVQHAHGECFTPALETSKTADVEKGDIPITQIDDEVKAVGGDRLQSKF
jgi:hypothetical protein